MIKRKRAAEFLRYDLSMEDSSFNSPVEDAAKASAGKKRMSPAVLYYDKLEKNSSDLAGEYFVAAELYRRGFSVGMTIGNAKEIDLFANKTDKTVSVQVKVIRNKRSGGWPMMREKVLNGILYVFVNLNDQGFPEYYIATPAETRRYIKQISTRGMMNLSTLKSGPFLNRWDKMELVKNELSKGAE